jgi:Leucine-rich repeat (LRR) protein
MPRMTLAYREYSELPREVVARFSDKLTELDLSHNNFQNLGSLSGLNKLDSLILDNNALTSHVQFPHFPELHTLSINRNRVENLAVFISQVDGRVGGAGTRG